MVVAASMRKGIGLMSKVLKKKRVAVIGGGIFGVSCALEMASRYEVTLFEQQDHLLGGATYANHNRHHYGFHYPRSPETVRQCLAGSVDFEAVYGGCLDWDFDNYYAVSKNDTKTTGSRYIEFCRKMGLSFSEQLPAGGVINESRIAVCLKVREGVYNIGILRELVLKRLATVPVDVRLGHRVVSGGIEKDGRKRLEVVCGSEKVSTIYDGVVWATYGRSNEISALFGFKPRLMQFNLQELDVIELPVERRIGLTVQDGPFPSVLPIAHTNQYLLAHVIESQLVREISSGEIPLLHRVPYVESNWERVQAVCSEYLPILKRAKYVRSIFVDRVVDGGRLQNDDRLTDIVAHGQGCWSIFGAKVLTCVTTAAKLRALVEQEMGS